MLIIHKTRYKQVGVKGVSLRATEIPELRKKIGKLLDQVDTKK